jgi:hypothetical protein
MTDYAILSLPIRKSISSLHSKAKEMLEQT